MKCEVAPIKQHVNRLEQIAGALNAWLLAMAIGLAVLDFTVLVPNACRRCRQYRWPPLLTTRGKR